MKLNINVFKYECVYVKNDDTERWQSSCIYFSFSPGLLPFTHLVVKHNLHLILDHGNNIKFYISFLLWGWIYRHEKKKKSHTAGTPCCRPLIRTMNDNGNPWKSQFCFPRLILTHQTMLHLWDHKCILSLKHVIHYLWRDFF